MERKPMTYALTQLAADIRETLKADSSPAAKEKICGYVSKALTDKAFVAPHLKTRTSGGHPREVLYEDPELGFCICGHVHDGPAHGSPHDHGSSWAIDGLAHRREGLGRQAVAGRGRQDLCDEPGRRAPL